MTMAVERSAAMFGCLTIFSTRTWSGKNKIASVSAQVIALRKGHAIRTQSRMPKPPAKANARRLRRLLFVGPAFCFIFSARGQIE